MNLTNEHDATEGRQMLVELLHGDLCMCCAEKHLGIRQLDSGSWKPTAPLISPQRKPQVILANLLNNDDGIDPELVEKHFGVTCTHDGDKPWVITRGPAEFNWTPGGWR
jgi:hypothetical protein